MDIEKLNTEISELLAKFGLELMSPVEITLGRNDQEMFSDSSLASCQAVRYRQSVEVRINAIAFITGDWHHVSGDDRRLHPDLRAGGEYVRNFPKIMVK